MSAHKRETKISGAGAEDEAAALVEWLRQEPDNASKIGDDLNNRYSASPRKMILAEFRTRLPQIHPRLSADAIQEFLKTQFDGVKDQFFTAHFREILGVATAIPGEDGLRVAAGLTIDVLRGSDYPQVQFRGVSGAGAVLTLVLEKLFDSEKPDPEQIRSWTEAAKTQLCISQAGSVPFAPEEAARVLDAISTVNRRTLPNSLVACVPSLIVLARVAGAARFLRSPIGEPFAAAFSGLTTSRNGSATPKDEIDNEHALPPRQLLAESLNRVTQIFDRFAAENDRLHERLHDQEAESARSIAAAETRIEERDRQLRIIKCEHEDEVQKLNSQIRELENAEKELVGSVERLRADLRVSDHNAQQSVSEQQDDQRRRLGEVLDPAIGSLRRDIEQALRRYPDNEEILHIGIAFDSLHRKLLRETSHVDDTRLPKELLNPQLR